MRAALWRRRCQARCVGGVGDEENRHSEPSADAYLTSAGGFKCQPSRVDSSKLPSEVFSL